MQQFAPRHWRRASVDLTVAVVFVVAGSAAVVVVVVESVDPLLLTRTLELVNLR